MFHEFRWFFIYVAVPWEIRVGIRSKMLECCRRSGGMRLGKVAVLLVGSFWNFGCSRSSENVGVQYRRRVMKGKLLYSFTMRTHTNVRTIGGEHDTKPEFNQMMSFRFFGESDSFNQLNIEKNICT